MPAGGRDLKDRSDHAWVATVVPTDLLRPHGRTVSKSSGIAIHGRNLKRIVTTRASVTVRYQKGGDRPRLHTKAAYILAVNARDGGLRGRPTMRSLFIISPLVVPIAGWAIPLARARAHRAQLRVRANR
jgi:hypothetical protein